MTTTSIDARAARASKEDRVLRHKLIDRLYHWVMALTVLMLLVTSIVPIISEMMRSGIWPTKAVAFGETRLGEYTIDWLTVHWLAGLLLIVIVLYHIVRASIWLSLKSMLVTPRDAVATWRAARWMTGAKGVQPMKPGKYPLAQRLYHHGIALFIITAGVTGLLMIRKITVPPQINTFWTGRGGWVNNTLLDLDAPIWLINFTKRDPYWFGADSAFIWGWTYVLHGVAALAVLSLVMLHIYFAIRPDKFWITRSMFVGWITARDYMEKFDPRRWKVRSQQTAAGDD